MCEGTIPDNLKQLSIKTESREELHTKYNNYTMELDPPPSFRTIYERQYTKMPIE